MIDNNKTVSPNELLEYSDKEAIYECKTIKQFAKDKKILENEIKEKLNDFISYYEVDLNTIDFDELKNIDGESVIIDFKLIFCID